MKKASTFKRVLKYVRPYTLSLVGSILLALIYSVATLLIPYFIGQAIDLLATGPINEKIYTYFLFIGISIITAGISLYLMSLCNNHSTYSLTKDMREDTFNKIHKLPLSYLDTHSNGDTVSRMVNDIDVLSDGLLVGFNQLFSGIVVILLTLVIMLILNWFMALIVIILTPLSVFVARFVATGIHKHFKEQADVKAEQTAFIDGVVPFENVVHSFNKQDDLNKEFEEISSRLAKVSLKATFFSSLVNPTTRLINALVYASIIGIGSMVLIGVINIGGATFTVGLLTTFLSYASQYAKPFNDISSVITELQNALTCAARVFELLDAEEELVSNDEISLDEVHGDIDFNDVNFSYTKNQKLIENFNFSCKSGMKIAIVGPTGCGKTTLINLLMRFYDVNSGTIKIDGVESKKIDRNCVHKNFGMVLQDTWIRYGSVKDNITLGANIPLEDIITAAKITHSYDFIMKMKDGYDTILEENGGNLSQGQKQLLCITRVMAKIPPMLILDEATSSIDTRTEMKIQKSFDAMMEGRTTFLVAHRLSTIQKADIILVMKDGNIIEQGNHEELLNQKGFYFNLYNSQFEGVN